MFISILMAIISLIGTIVVIILIVAATKPANFRVARSITINATPDKIFPHISDFNNWAAWSPWEKLDPAMKKTLSGSASGKGAIYEWSGNKKAGTGRMEILETTEPTKIRIKLDFMKPMEAHNTLEYTLEPAGNTTNVTWAMLGNNNFMGKVFSVFMNMDKLVGKDFETGLASLKALAEKSE